MNQTHIITSYDQGGRLRGAGEGAIKIMKWLQELSPEMSHNILQSDINLVAPSPHDTEAMAHFYNKISEYISHYTKPIMIGGDHSVALAHWSGVVQGLRQKNIAQEIGMIWVDAHLDSHTHQTSPSGNIHGMPLASLMGAGEKSWAKVGGFSPKINPHRMVFLGTRSYEPAELDFIKEIGATIFFSDELFSAPYETTQKAIQIAQGENGKWGASFDVDFLDPNIASATGCHEKDGATLDILTTVLTCFQSSTQNLCGLELVEYFPSLDQHDKSFEIVKHVLHHFQSFLSFH